MKLKSAAMICKSAKRYILYYQYDPQTKLQRQWLGDDHAAYALDGLPILRPYGLKRMLDITDRQRCVVMERNVPNWENWGNSDPQEREVSRSSGMEIIYKGCTLLPLRTSQGVIYIYKSYLSPLDHPDAPRLYERKGDMGLFIVAKEGDSLNRSVAVIHPANIIDYEFTKSLNCVITSTRDALRQSLAGDPQSQPDAQPAE